MMYISAVMGGPELARSPLAKALDSLRAARTENDTASGTGSVDIVFHVPGSITQPRFKGARTSTFSSKERTMMIQVAVPTEQVNAPDVRWLLESLRSAIRLAKPKFEKAGIPYPEAEYLATVERMEKELAH